MTIAVERERRMDTDFMENDDVESTALPFLASHEEEMVAASNNMPLAELVEQAKAIEADSHDDLLPAAELQAIWEDDRLQLVLGKQAFTVGKQAYKQLCKKMRVPRQYMTYCMKNGKPDLALQNINTWLQASDKTLLVRQHKDRIRGLLSDKYSVMDSPQVLQILQEQVGDQYVLKNHFINEERFHARLVLPDQIEIEGEDLFNGIQIDTSDVGRNQVNVRFLVFKQICTNGLIVEKLGGELFKQRHYGIDHDQFVAGLTEGLQNLPWVAASVQENIEFARGTDFIVEDLEEALKSDPLIMKFKRATKTSDETIAEVVQRAGHYGNTRWGFINAITEVAQKYEIERRIKLEKFAGELLLDNSRTNTRRTNTSRF